MMPYLFKIGNFELRIYSLMIIIGLLICIYMAGRKMVKMGYKKEYLELLLLADEQESMVDRYLDRGSMYALFEDGDYLNLQLNVIRTSLRLFMKESKLKEENL